MVFAFGIIEGIERKGQKVKFLHEYIQIHCLIITMNNLICNLIEYCAKINHFVQWVSVGIIFHLSNKHRGTIILLGY